MKRISLFCIFCFIAMVAVYAGDVAEFKDIGFSEDGSVYFFAQYGVTDKDFFSYAEIYSVDVKNNMYITNGVFKTLPSEQTVWTKGKNTFEKLYEKGSYFFNKYKTVPTSVDNILYIRGSVSGVDENEIRVKDFENSTVDNPVFYHFQLVSNFEGSGINTKGSFFVGVEKKDNNGKILERKVVGNASRKRSGVSSYKIDKIFTDKTGKNMVIVIEKQVIDHTGTSIRYMVETLSF
ncbi:MAG: DUF2259 domain-containing protein [Treponema sp.]|nr:DUF2259 domain-containing protein [Treponema sp.]